MFVYYLLEIEIRESDIRENGIRKIGISEYDPVSKMSIQKLGNSIRKKVQQGVFICAHYLLYMHEKSEIYCYKIDNIYLFEKKVQFKLIKVLFKKKNKRTCVNLIRSINFFENWPSSFIWAFIQRTPFNIDSA